MKLAVVGAGPAGLALALHAARLLPQAAITVFDARADDGAVARDPRTLALALGSMQLLQQLQAWPAAQVQPINSVHVSQAPPSLAQGEVLIDARSEGVAMLGAVLRYGTLVEALEQAWRRETERAPQRLALRLATPVRSVKPLAAGVELDADVAERFDLAVIAEGGVFAEQAHKAITHDYRQTAWVGSVQLQGAPDGMAFERFTRSGPLALLPLPPGDDSRAHAALVWCVDADDDPVRELADPQRLALMQSLLPPAAGRIQQLSPLKAFALGLNAERSLVQGRVVRIGNAAQTLHPVAGQGLNLGLRDAHALVSQLRQRGDVDAALRSLDRQRALDRWATIASTDFLARSFAWRWPALAPMRAGALALLDRASPLKSLLARQMMFGMR
jgi:2-octaprenyl-6-methoxyphenol hydroxylase